MDYRPLRKNAQYEQKRDAAGGSLGNTTNFSAPPVNTGLDALDLSSIFKPFDKDTGEVFNLEYDGRGAFKEKFDRCEFRRKKYALQSTARHILPSTFNKNKPRRFRVKTCLRNILSVNDDKISIYKSKEHGNCHYGGLMICGSVWTCPVCASKITERKSAIIKPLMDAHIKNNGVILFITLTFPHTNDQSLEFLLDRFKKAENGFQKTKPVKAIKDSIGFIEPIKSLEITYGHENGWHPHSHQLWFLESDVDISGLKTKLYSHWKNYCESKGLGTPNFKNGIDVQKIDDHEDTADYICKMGWNGANEVTKGHTKKAKGNRFAPFDLLQEYLDNESFWSKERFIEYSIHTFGKHYISRFPKLQKMYDIEDKDDETLAEESQEDSDLLGKIEYDDWRLILKHDERATILQIAEEQGFEKVLVFLSGLKNRKKIIKKTPIKKCDILTT